MLSTYERKPLGQQLLTRGMLSAEQLERALDEQNRSDNQKLLGEVLVEMNLCDEDQIAEALAKAYGVPFARVSPKIADPKVIGTLPQAFCEKHSVLPLFLVEGVLTVAVPEPADVFLLEEIERLGGHPVQVVAATARQIKATLAAYLPGENIFVIDDRIEEVRPEDFSLVSLDGGALPPAASDDAPATKLASYAIYRAVREGASDIHVEPGGGALRIRFRVDGRLQEGLRAPLLMHEPLTRRLKIMAGLDPAERRLPQEGVIRVRVGDRRTDLRASTMPAAHGERIVLRVVDADKANVNLEKIGFSYDTLKQWRKLLGASHGLLLVAGPSGSGKRTTLYASLAELKRDDVNLCTVEDPVERAVAGVNQFQVDEKAGLTFAAALRGLLRQDPDVIMLGAIRDADTARTAAQAALAGKLVLGALQTNDAPGAVARLYHLGVEPYLVGASLRGVLAQRLVRKLCQACREPYTPTIHERRQLEKQIGDVDTLYRPKGCPQCRNAGYIGRIGIHELLVVSVGLVDKVSGGASLADLRAAAEAQEMKPLRLDGMDKVRAGITTLEEVYRVTA